MAADLTYFHRRCRSPRAAVNLASRGPHGPGWWGLRGNNPFIQTFGLKRITRRKSWAVIALHGKQKRFFLSLSLLTSFLFFLLQRMGVWPEAIFLVKKSKCSPSSLAPTLPPTPKGFSPGGWVGCPWFIHSFTPSLKVIGSPTVCTAQPIWALAGPVERDSPPHQPHLPSGSFLGAIGGLVPKQSHP